MKKQLRFLIIPNDETLIRSRWFSASAISRCIIWNRNTFFQFICNILLKQLEPNVSSFSRTSCHKWNIINVQRNARCLRSVTISMRLNQIRRKSLLILKFYQNCVSVIITMDTCTDWTKWRQCALFVVIQIVLSSFHHRSISYLASTIAA